MWLKYTVLLNNLKKRLEDNMSKLVLFDEEAYAKIDRAVDETRRAVGATLGPRAHNVIFKRPFGVPGVVHDGVTVAKELDPSDPFESAATELIKEAAKATNDEAGDGTTTAIIVAHSLYSEGRKLVAAGHNAQMLRKGVEKAVDQVTGYLQSTAIPIKTNDQQLQIANISSQNEKIGKEVAKAFEKLGNDAVIAVEESKQNHIYSEYKDGMEIDQGYLNRYFLTNPEFDEAVVEKANIIVMDIPLSSAQDMDKLFKNISQLGIDNNLVIISPEVKDIALATLIQNKINGLSTLAINAPSYGDEQAERLEDIAVSVGATFVSKSAGRKLGDLTLEDIGNAQKVVASKDTTTIVNGMDDPAKKDARVEELKKRLKKENISEFEMERLQERIAKLTSGIAIINVGARTEGEAKELKERAIDAVEAIKAANEKGIVAGGETPLLRASWALEDSLSEIKDESEEVVAGYKLVVKAMQHPFRTLMENSGLDAGQMLERLKSVNKEDYGVDVIDGKVKDLLKNGVIDPVKVPISALLNATSASMSLLTSGVIIVDEVKDKEADIV